MGLDYAEKVARSFRKGLDRTRIEAGTPSLFRQQPDCAPRSYAATVRKGHSLSAGDELCVRNEGDQVVAFRGLTPVATFTNPPAALKEALAAGREGYGTVQDVHDAAQMAEIAVC